MKKIVNVWRYVTLALLMLAALLCFMATPTNSLSLGAFLLSLIVSKALCVLFFWLCYVLYNLWNERGHMDELNDLFKEKEGDK